jgi:hypothetical protein
MRLRRMPPGRRRSDPRRCNFDSARDVARCAAGQDGGDCLTERQSRAIPAIYEGIRLPAGERHFHGFPRGSEGGWPDWIIAPPGKTNAYMQDKLALSGDEQRLIGLVNRMRLFAPPDVVGEAEAVLKAIIAVSLEPGVDIGQLARAALSEGLDPDPFLAFSLACRADLDNVRRTRAPLTGTRRRKLAAMSSDLPRHSDPIHGPGVRPAPALTPGW